MQGCRRLMGDTPQVGVFDTAFYAGMEDKAYICLLYTSSCV